MAKGIPFTVAKKKLLMGKSSSASSKIPSNIYNKEVKDSIKISGILTKISTLNNCLKSEKAESLDSLRKR